MGSQLFDYFLTSFKVSGISRDNSSNTDFYPCDITDSGKLSELLDKLNPDILIHMAAVSALNACEENPEYSYQVNSLSTKYLSEWAAVNNRKLIFTSTDQVFDGKKSFYTESDGANPLSVYGKQKLEAEEIVLKDKNGLVLRLPLLLGLGKYHRKGIMHGLIQSLQKGEKVNLFTDEYRTPISAFEVCKVIEWCIQKNLSGLYHVAGKERLSRYDLGLLIADIFELDKELIVATTRSEAGMEQRPADLSMSVEKLMNSGYMPVNILQMLDLYR